MWLLSQRWMSPKFLNRNCGDPTKRNNRDGFKILRRKYQSSRGRQSYISNLVRLSAPFKSTIAFLDLDHPKYKLNYMLRAIFTTSLSVDQREIKIIKKTYNSLIDMKIDVQNCTYLVLWFFHGSFVVNRNEWGFRAWDRDSEFALLLCFLPLINITVLYQ